MSPETTRAATPATGATPILEIEDLNISFYTRKGEIPAVMDFSMTVMPGESMGLVGESGCGKSTVSLGIMRYLGNNGGIKSGTIKFMGRDMATMSEAELRDLRGSKISMVYQEPMASLNPAMKIGRQLTEVLTAHEGVSEEEARGRAAEMMGAVRLPDPDRIMGAYPHQLSGGQQQRVVISMALLSKPQLLLLDEPTTALDVTVEAGIVDLIKDLAREFGTSMIFVSHNLGLILETCDRITVMYSGEAVEEGDIGTVFNRMRHPYTKGLLRSIPVPGTNKYARPLVAIPGQLPLPHERPFGCNFGPRCPHCVPEICDAGPIAMRDLGQRHRSRCARIGEIDWAADAFEGEVAEPIEVGDVVVSVDHLKKHYAVSTGMFGGGDTRTVKANEDLTFNAREAETVAIVGESGCGKSTFAKVLMGLETATDGTVRLGNLDIAHLPVERRDARTVSQVQMVFQNPFDTLNPSMTVGDQIVRVLEQFEVGELGRRSPRAHAGPARSRETAARVRGAEAAPALGRAEAAHRHRPRLCRAAAAGGRGRARLGAGRLGAGGGDQAADRHPAREPHDNALHQPRSGRGALSGRPHRRDVSRPDHGAGHDRTGLLAALPPLYRGAALGRAGRRHARAQASGRARG